MSDLELTLEEQIVALKAENAELKEKTKEKTGNSFKVGDKGTIVIRPALYGRFPFASPYPSQLVKAFRDCKGGIADEAHRFVLANLSGLTFRDEEEKELVESACKLALGIE